ncbi:hypothetical protein XENTR_v10007501 [Xenopus tropicalis]|nr:hypothetical protein XENTR_v10007501 [Xenopus tropicalis]
MGCAHAPVPGTDGGLLIPCLCARNYGDGVPIPHPHAPAGTFGGFFVPQAMVIVGSLYPSYVPQAMVIVGSLYPRLWQ